MAGDRRALGSFTSLLRSILGYDVTSSDARLLAAALLPILLFSATHLQLQNAFVYIQIFGF
jgi:hypothetical protein